MGRSALPTTLAICCRLPSDGTGTRTDACLQVARRVAVPVTWITTVEQLPELLAQGADAVPSQRLAVEISDQQSQAAFRRQVTRAVSAAPGLETVALRGPLSQEQRRVLVDNGVRIVCRDRLDDGAHGSRRPAPPGWPCRSTLWGLWEVLVAGDGIPPGIITRLLPWVRSRAASGGLIVADVGRGRAADSAAIEGPLAQWQAWAGRASATFVHLADVPGLIAGGGRLPVAGSVLRQAAA